MQQVVDGGAAGALRARRNGWMGLTGIGALAVAVTCVACSSPAAPTDASMSSNVGTDASVSSSEGTGTMAGPDAGRPPEVLVPGLRARDRTHHFGSPRQAPHFNKIVVVDDVAYVANATDALMAYHLEEDGTFGDSYDARQDSASYACQALAAHPASDSLYCRTVVDAIRDVLVFDISQAMRPTPRPLMDRAPSGYSVPALTVLGDTLFAAALGDGLLRAALEPDGTPGPFERVLPELTMVDEVVTTDAGTLLVRDRSSGLWVVSEGLEVLASGPMDGPPTGLAGDESWIAAGLGSLGAAVFRVAGSSLEPVASVAPPCVVSAVDVSDGLLAVGCLSGVFVYELASAAPRLIGFEPSLGVLLDVVFVQGDLLAADWRWLHRYEINRDGVVLMIDRPRGRHVADGESTSVTVRNVGEVHLDVEVHARVGDDLHLVTSLELPAHSDGTFDVSAAQIAEYRDEWGLTELQLSSAQGRGIVEDYAFIQKVSLVSAVASDHQLRAPALGGAFPTLQVSDTSDNAVLVPPQGAPARVVFLGLTCAGMFDELLDLDWRYQHMPGELPVVAIDDQLPAYAGNLREQWGLALPVFVLGGTYASVVGHDQPSAAAIYDEALQIMQIPGGAAHPTDYTIDADHRVLQIERVYRGPYPL